MNKNAKPLNTVAVSNNTHSQINLTELLEDNRKLELIAKLNCYEPASRIIQELQPEAVFLELNPPITTGLKLAQEITGETKDSRKPHTPLLVLVSHHTQYALDAFRMEAVDYLLFPITTLELNRVVNKLSSLHQQRMEYKEVSQELYKIKNLYSTVQERKDVQKSSNPTGTITCMGKFDIFIAGKSKEVHWPTRKTEELVSYLIAYSNKKVDKWFLCDLLWPEHDPKKSKDNLYTSIYRAKQVIKEKDLPMEIKSSNNCYCLELKDNCMVDFIYFQQAVNSIMIITKENLGLALEIEKLYQEELFEDKGYQWAFSLSESLKKQYHKLIHNLADYYLNIEKPETAILYFKKFLEIHPYEEETMEKLMQILIQMDNKSQLIKYYSSYEIQIQEEFGVSPSKRLQELYQAGAGN